MRIGIDATIFANPNFTGIANSVQEVLKIWASNYNEHEYYLISDRKIYLEFQLPENWHMVVRQGFLHSQRYWWWFEREHLIKELDIDVYWGTSYSLPRKNGKTKYIVSIYDMALFLFKDIGDPAAEKNIRKNTKRACRRANKIIAISKATADDVYKILGINREKIEISYCGGLQKKYVVGTIDKPDNSCLNIDGDFFLFLSTIEPRKNIPTIIKAFEIYKGRWGGSEKLVLAGRKGWRCDSIFDAIQKSKYCHDIIVPGYISNNDKIYLLSHAKAFLYPSLYEGFGIPVLEAFAYNLPVITTNISSLPEVAGEAGYYIEEPGDYSTLSDRINEVMELNEDDLIKLRKSMKNQLAKFSWEKNAREIMQIIEKCFSNK